MATPAHTFQDPPKDGWQQIRRHDLKRIARQHGLIGDGEHPGAIVLRDMLRKAGIKAPSGETKEQSLPVVSTKTFEGDESDEAPPIDAEELALQQYQADQAAAAAAPPPPPPPPSPADETEEAPPEPPPSPSTVESDIETLMAQLEKASMKDILAAAKRLSVQFKFGTKKADLLELIRGKIAPEHSQ